MEAEPEPQQQQEAEPQPQPVEQAAVEEGELQQFQEAQKYLKCAKADKKAAKMDKIGFPEKKEKIILDEDGGMMMQHHDVKYEKKVKQFKMDKIKSAKLMGGEEKIKQMKGKVLKSKQKEAGKTRAARAGLTFPVARIHGKLKNLVPAQARVGGTAAVFMAAVLEYLVAELCELAGNKAKSLKPGGNQSAAAAANRGGEGQNAKKNNRSRITPRLLQYAIKEDNEFRDLLQSVTLREGGVVPLTEKD